MILLQISQAGILRTIERVWRICNIDAWRENSNSSAMYERHSLDVWTDVYDFRTEFCRGEGQIE